jgi:hypothetical protein
VPNLAWEIVLGNKRAQEAESAAAAASEAGTAAAAAAATGVSPGRGFINLKGFFVGNAWTDAAIDNEGMGMVACCSEQCGNGAIIVGNAWTQQP